MAKLVVSAGMGQCQILVATVLYAFASTASAAEHVTLKNGSEFDCIRREAAEGSRVRLIFSAGNFLEIAAGTVARVETVADSVLLPTSAPAAVSLAEMVARSGAEHRVDVDLLASVIRAESGGRSNAVSKTGARGLMQLMPATAATLGVEDSFAPEQNISGGTAYLDMLLTRYHDDVRLALAAYNAGPGAVDRYHGVPPYAETRNYVRRVINDFNRRKVELGMVRAPGGATAQVAAR